MEHLFFFRFPTVTIATNTFINVPTILQYESTPLIEVVKTEKAGFTVQIPIYHSDGTYLAKAVGSRLITSDIGKKAGLTLKYLKNITACELDGKTLFEIQRDGAAALKTRAELFTPDGAFVKCSDNLLPVLFSAMNAEALTVGGITASHCTFQDLRIGFWIRKDGGVAAGVS
jgi:hypothetical protein